MDVVGDTRVFQLRRIIARANRMCVMQSYDRFKVSRSKRFEERGRSRGIDILSSGSALGDLDLSSGKASQLAFFTRFTATRNVGSL